MKACETNEITWKQHKTICRDIDRKMFHIFLSFKKRVFFYFLPLFFCVILPCPDCRQWLRAIGRKENISLQLYTWCVSGKKCSMAQGIWVIVDFVYPPSICLWNERREIENRYISYAYSKSNITLFIEKIAVKLHTVFINLNFFFIGRLRKKFNEYLSNCFTSGKRWTYHCKNGRKLYFVMNEIFPRASRL